MVWRFGLHSLDNNCIFWTAKPLKRVRKDVFGATHPWHSDVLSNPAVVGREELLERIPLILKRSLHGGKS